MLTNEGEKPLQPEMEPPAPPKPTVVSNSAAVNNMEELVQSQLKPSVIEDTSHQDSLYVPELTEKIEETSS